MTTPFPFVSGAVLTAAQMNDITNLPINDQTASYSLVVGDAGKRVVMNVATANTVTVDDSVFTTGDTIFVANKDAATTITAGAGVTINSASGLVLVAHQSGQLVALSASSFLFVLSAAGSSGVVQVKSTIKTDTFSLQSVTYTDVTDLSVSITPTSATNKILVAVSMMTGNNTSVFFFARLMRDSTAIAVGDAAGNRTRVTGSSSIDSNDVTQSLNMTFLDSPATTSAVNYKVQIRSSGAGGNVRVNRSDSDTDVDLRPRGVSTITVFEVTP